MGEYVVILWVPDHLYVAADGVPWMAVDAESGGMRRERIMFGGVKLCRDSHVVRIVEIRFSDWITGSGRGQVAVRVRFWQLHLPASLLRVLSTCQLAQASRRLATATGNCEPVQAVRQSQPGTSNGSNASSVYYPDAATGLPLSLSSRRLLLFGKWRSRRLHAPHLFFLPVCPPPTNELAKADRLATVL